ncbi:hypothetical protein LMG22037_03679 [Paraburkholderia phenoliruptrix]|uniref:Uncharacterized protein n=1 Tax=Paraburkholderia phenoliruptrix TaxID=252970 RepID=A0A6J5BHB9_9BURK|nr:hypothetical protein LMG22037_03679 [Paraburkholderia phenoliruptrix]
MTIPFEYIERSITVGMASSSNLVNFQSALQQLLDFD